MFYHFGNHGGLFQRIYYAKICIHGVPETCYMRAINLSRPLVKEILKNDIASSFFSRSVLIDGHIILSKKFIKSLQVIWMFLGLFVVKINNKRISLLSKIKGQYENGAYIVP